MTEQSLHSIIRAKKLGVLLCNARQVVAKEPQDCADLLGVPLERYEAYELGDIAPSLPEVEGLANYLRVPLAHFWGDRLIISDEAAVPDNQSIQKNIQLRQKVIGTMLRKACQEQGIDFESLAKKLNMTADQIEQFELAEDPLPLPLLEELSKELGQPIEGFQNQPEKVDVTESVPEVSDGFMELPAELREFIKKPVNRPYLELAARLSKMSNDQLRLVAEGILEITL
jgi:transcriptional regulator with XRE-family HTH domain